MLRKLSLLGVLGALLIGAAGCVVYDTPGYYRGGYYYGGPYHNHPPPYRGYYWR